MNARYFSLLILLLILALPGMGAVVQLPNSIEVDGVISTQGRRSTLDFLTFRLCSEGEVVIITGIGFGAPRVLILAEYIGVDDEFGFLGNPFRLEQRNPSQSNSMLRTLSEGTYVAIMASSRAGAWDTWDGYDPVDDDSGPFSEGFGYSYTIAGDVLAIDFREGNLNNTFTTTRIPEARILSFVAISAFFMVLRSRRS